MRRLTQTVSLALFAVASVEVAAAQQAIDAGVAGTVSVIRQLRLKRKLLMGSESLVAVLRTNRENWDRYTPEQRQLLRERAYAFRHADQQRRQAVLDAYGRFLQLSGDQKHRYRRRAAWLGVVIGALSDEKRAELLGLSATERARQLLRLKAQMQADGKLPQEVPPIEPATTQPAADTASDRPAAKADGESSPEPIVRSSSRPAAQ